MSPNPQDPPHNFEAEQALIGSVLRSNQAYHRCSEIVDAAHFADALHQQIWKAMAALIEHGQQASVFSMKAYLDGNPDAKAAGGAAYLARLLASSGPVQDAHQLAQVVRDLYMRRQLLVAGHEMMQQAYSSQPDTTPVQMVETVERMLYEIVTSGQAETGFVPFSKALAGAISMAEQAYRRDGKTVGVATGLRALDKIMGGLNASDLVILAGRPSMGKTALATNIAFHAARQHRLEEGKTVDGAVVGFFSLEMSAEQLATRIIAEQAGVPSDKIMKGEMIQSDFDRVLTCAAELERIPLFIDDTPGMTISGIRTRARRLKRTHGLDLIVVDYLQLITPPKGVDGRVNQVGEITRGLKILAKELNVPVLALSQLSREVEKRDDKRPQLADLRDSGTIEQDADVVMFIYREEYYLRKEEPQEKNNEDPSGFQARHTKWRTRLEGAAGRAEVGIDKQRHGPVGKALLRFDASLTRFADLDEGR
jgi:replicative DNA helicase